MPHANVLSIIENVRLLDVGDMSYRDDRHIVIENQRIREISDAPVRLPDARRIDAAGRVVMPGLIDAHVHAMAYTSDFVGLAHQSPYYVAARAGAVLRDMLMRGFTTVRDAGGADAGLKKALDQNILTGPRLLICDLGLAQAGGQGDFRVADAAQIGCASCHGRRSITKVVDGTDDVRRAVREIIRNGADHIKVMASGGVASGIPIDRLQFGGDELRVMVEEAERVGLYVMAHAYKDDAVRHCLDAGVRSIEHASHLSDGTLAAVIAAGAAIVPTLSVYQAQIEAGSTAAGLFQEMRAASLSTIERAQRQGVSIGFGTDLSGAEHAHQSGEFRLRAESQDNAAIIASATKVNAAICGQQGQIGEIRPGAFADLLIVDGDPLADIGCVAEPEDHLCLIMKGGTVYKNTL
ncbi:metal-dependent hydrolase family protein [Roseovarius pelagicus]|uniref:Amidohydrolase family protein n=1 Tax=Roseovarius pelagicus TaxID=2980108 RepID=A0ABY6D9G1_9RHOB|nr:amidohydrolase family protein [Roseovarius pelagicus]UXX82776.1 amidohydrolase family protein [Roseovarius pelagicus]